MYINPPNLVNNVSTLKESPLRSSLSPLYCSYAISKCESIKCPKQVLNGDLQIEVWTTIKKKLYGDLPIEVLTTLLYD